MKKLPEKEKLLIGILVGLLLVVIAVPLPGEKKKEKKTVSQSDISAAADNTEERLKRILSRISGVGKVEVFITYEDKGRVVVEKDEVKSENLVREMDSSGGNRTTSSEEQRQETVYGAGEQPCIVQELTPKAAGVLVVAEGAGSPAVKKQIKETIEALFGLDAHKISIMKMEVSK